MSEVRQGPDEWYYHDLHSPRSSSTYTTNQTDPNIYSSSTNSKIDHSYDEGVSNYGSYQLRPMNNIGKTEITECAGGISPCQTNYPVSEVNQGLDEWYESEYHPTLHSPRSRTTCTTNQSDSNIYASSTSLSISHSYDEEVSNYGSHQLYPGENISSGYCESNDKMHPNRGHLPYKEAPADFHYNYH